jgi:hypothetical protein
MVVLPLVVLTVATKNTDATNTQQYSTAYAAYSLGSKELGVGGIARATSANIA